MPNLESLQRFFGARFSNPELREMVYYLPHGREIVSGLPDVSVSIDEYTFAVVQSLQRNGVLNALFWRRLRSMRPLLVAEIAAITADTADGGVVSSQALSLIVARTKRYESTAELEFVVRNETASPQIIKEIRLEARNIEVDYTPLFTLFDEYRSDRFVVSLWNKGWSSLALEATVTLSSDDSIVSVRPLAMTIPVGVTTELVGLSKRELFRHNRELAVVRISGRGTASPGGAQVEVERQYKVYRSRFDDVGSANDLVPDTTYICLFTTAESVCRKSYPILRKVPPHGLDVFVCAVSANRSAAFDLVVELVTADSETLSTCEEGLKILRVPGNGWKIQDGDVFILGSKGVWELAPRRSWSAQFAPESAD